MAPTDAGRWVGWASAWRSAIAGALWWLGDRVAPPRQPDEMERVMVERLNVQGSRIDFALSHSIVKQIAGYMASWFDLATEGSAGNYVETAMVAPCGRRFTMTLRPETRPTPHELRERAEARVRELEAQLAPTPTSAVTEP